MTDDTIETAPAHRPQTVTDEEIEEKLYASCGNISAVASAYGISRQWMATRIRRSSHLSEVLKESREKIVDIAEVKLVSAINNGESWAVALVLKTLGKNRGYTEKVEQEISGNLGVTIIDDVK